MLGERVHKGLNLEQDTGLERKPVWISVANMSEGTRSWPPLLSGHAPECPITAFDLSRQREVGRSYQELRQCEAVVAACRMQR